MIILDTSIIIEHLRVAKGHPTQYKLLAQHYSDQLLCLSMISVQELYQGNSTLLPLKEQVMLSTITALKILPYDYEIASLAGQLTRDSVRTLTFPDAAIAATSIINNASLFTLNRKDFEGIKDLELLNLTEKN